MVLRGGVAGTVGGAPNHASLSPTGDLGAAACLPTERPKRKRYRAS